MYFNVQLSLSYVKSHVVEFCVPGTAGVEAGEPQSVNSDLRVVLVIWFPANVCGGG